MIRDFSELAHGTRLPNARTPGNLKQRRGNSPENGREKQMARQEGFEPPTCGLEVRCSIQLSYWRVRVENDVGTGKPVSMFHLCFRLQKLVSIPYFTPGCHGKQRKSSQQHRDYGLVISHTGPVAVSRTITPCSARWVRAISAAAQSFRWRASSRSRMSRSISGASGHSWSLSTARI